MDAPGFDALSRTFEAWRLVRVGGREYVDAVVAPAHRGPSAELTAALKAWRGAHYWTDPTRTGLVLVRPVAGERPERWWLHILLGLVTVVCALGAGATLAGAWLPSAEPTRYGPLAGAVLSGFRFFGDVARGAWRDILPGASFAFPLLAILLVHELGHYFTARRYGIDTSPPFFLPVPPSLSPIGSLGAFIRMRSPVLDRRQLLDVGAAGPLAGFVVTVVVLILGYARSEGLSLGAETAGEFVTYAGRQIYLGDSLLTLALRRHFFPDAAAVYLSPMAFAGWVGAFVTALNLVPLSQLDGGHVLYAMFGKRQTTIGAAALIALLLLGRSSPSWWIWGVLALLIGGGRWTHPSVLAPERPVPPRRRWIGWACIVVFALTFVPVPFVL
ncbi:MAG TPA: site-2 protease family protein [Gemmatimonadales bacterium]|nr:site-2 protease family protein [Gemmatimonadales bacterium]